MRTYTYWIGGSEGGRDHKIDFSVAKKRAKLLCESQKKTVFVCFEKRGADIPEPLTAYRFHKGKVKAFLEDKEGLRVAFAKVVAIAKKGGAPRKNESGSSTVSFSVSIDEKNLFEHYTKKFADGNKSEMFRRMFSAWEKMMEQVIGTQKS